MRAANIYLAVICMLFNRRAICEDPVFDIDRVLPALNCVQQVHLFGNVVKMKQAGDEFNGGRQGKSMDVFFESTVVEFPSPVSNNTIAVKLSDFVNSNTDVEGRGRLKKLLMPILLALTIIAAIVIPALMTVIKLIAVKGLWSGVVSLIISKLIGLKALLQHHHHVHESSNEGRRPYLIYLPNGGKHRREEEDGGYQTLQGQEVPWQQYGQDDWKKWKREDTVQRT